jgi:hypothetical protein
MTGNDSMFTSLEDLGDHNHVTYGDNTRGRVADLERIAITKDFSISNVLYVESLSFNLLYVAQLCDFGLMCTFDKYGVIVFHKKDKSLVFKGFRYGHIYLMDFSEKEVSSMTCLFFKTSLGWLWYRRITHIRMSNLKKAINTVCHAINRVYLHWLLEKTPYELIVGRKHNISYFRVFGCKCFIYKKKILGKFESRCDEGFFLGYASNCKAYRVFNKISGQVEETCDAKFDESDGSQGEVVGYDHIGDEEVQKALKNMSIGDIKPQVGEASTLSTIHSMKPNVDEEEDKEVPPTHPRVKVPSTQVQDQVDPIVQSSSQIQDNYAQPP